ncbi:MAG: phosphotransferase [Aliivibrio sp.]|uniref:phosphotransferase n=1 Tax=Aliivibrio sp. TaxID=1872443 RepID=UPI001A4AEE8C|nr:phosphotransferase [Aliivibrio sp.]
MAKEDKQIIVQDSELAGLSIILDEELMLIKARELFGDITLYSVSKCYLRYKKGVNCLAKYLFNHDRGTSQVYIKAYRQSDHNKLMKAQQRVQLTSDRGLGRRFCTELNLVMCSFPNDDKLKVLSRLVDPVQRDSLLQRVMDSPSDFTGCELIQLQYKPERRFVAKLISPSGQMAVIKIYTSARFINADQASRQSMKGDHLLTIIGRSSKHHILVYQWIDGLCLSDEYRKLGFQGDILSQTGRFLAHFHKKKSIESLALHSTESFVQKLLQLSKGVAELVPSLKKRAYSLTHQLAFAIRSLPLLPERIHGDFYAKQVLIEHQTINVIDLDDACCWFRHYDIGLFIAHVEWDCLRGRISRTSADHYKKCFLRGYKKYSQCSEKEVALFIAVGLMQLAHHPFRNCEPDWPNGIDLIITRCEFYLQCYLSAELVQRKEANRDDTMPFLIDILDCNKMTYYFKQLNIFNQLELQDASVVAAHICRHKRHKRVLVEYMLQPENSNSEPLYIIGKARSKGLDKRTWKLNQHLYSTTFNDKSRDGIHVPEPLAMISSCHMWLQRKVEGEVVFGLLCGDSGASVAARVAQAIYKLHSTEIVLKKKHLMGDELAILASNLKLVIENHPEWRCRLERILSLSSTLASKLPKGAHSVIHRDFYHDQLLMNQHRLYLLDLDLCCFGDPALDIGNFIAHIEEQCLRVAY